MSIEEDYLESNQEKLRNNNSDSVDKDYLLSNNEISDNKSEKA